MSSQEHQPSETPASLNGASIVLDSRRYRIVTLTNQRPVQIADDEWGEISRAEFEGLHKEQPRWGEMVEPGKSATYSAEAKLMVRRHADGRFLVYGTYSLNGVFISRHGEIVPNPETVQPDCLPHCPADGGWKSVVDAIKRVCSSLEGTVPLSRIPYDTVEVRGLAMKCVSNLPFQDLVGDPPGGRLIQRPGHGLRCDDPACGWVGPAR